MNNLARLILPLFCLASIAGGALLSSVRAQQSAEWAMGGQNLFNTRNQPAETIINAQNAGGLALRWVFTTEGNTPVTPAVVDGGVYAPDWQGNLFKIDANTGQKIWSRKLSEYTGRAGTYSRSYPVVDGNVVYIGAQTTMDGSIKSPATLIAVNASNGDALWVKEIDSQPAAVITQAPVVFNGVVYVGVSSLEEIVAVSGSYPCCTFRGNLVAVDALTGNVLWRTYMVPDNNGHPDAYSGAAIWGSTPVVDAARKTVYVATGNNYTIPRGDQRCIAAGRGPACNNSQNHFDSVIALDLDTGGIKWATGVREFDTWTLGCILLFNPNCPLISGPDADFGSGANLFSANIQGQTRQLLGIGSKSGIYWALEPDTGKVVWATRTGPGGALGGIIWGSAVDGQRVYVASANSTGTPWKLINGQTVRSGFWSALDAATGRILWETPDPLGAQDHGALTVANGVLYAASIAPTGSFYALDAATGQILWSFAGGGSAIAGPAVVNGVVYWGSGYSRWGLASNNKLYAFALPAFARIPAWGDRPDVRRPRSGAPQ